MSNRPFPSNVCGSIGAPFEGQGEEAFFLRLFDCLQQQMGEAFAKFEFVIHRRVFGEFAGSRIDLLEGGEQRVLIIISDEKEAFPIEEHPGYRAVFRAYGCPESIAPHVHSFPVGYFNAAGRVEPVPFEQRPTSVFFSGCLNRNRLELYRQFRSMPWLPNTRRWSRQMKEVACRIASKVHRKRHFDNAFEGGRIGFTEWFGKGLPPEEYAEVLRHTKIALCPAGFHSNETIRHWEAMRLGCVIISEPLPPNRFYQDSPIIEINDWRELRPLLDDLLSEPEELHRIHRATCSWWENICSEKAVAAHMASILAV